MANAHRILSHCYVLQFLLENFQEFLGEFGTLRPIPYIPKHISQGKIR